MHIGVGYNVKKVCRAYREQNPENDVDVPFRHFRVFLAGYNPQLKPSSLTIAGGTRLSKISCHRA